MGNVVFRGKSGKVGGWAGGYFGGGEKYRVYPTFVVYGNIKANLNLKNAFLSVLLLSNQINILAFQLRTNFKKISCHNFLQLPVTNFLKSLHIFYYT